MAVSSASVVSPISEPGADIQPNLLMHILREWPDAVARMTIVAVAGILFWLTWAHWGSFQVDTGRELYVPYQILRGKLLYRDIFYSFGPLAPYFEAFMLRLFGLHLYILYIFGLAIAIVSVLLLFDIGVMIEGRAAGVTAALAGLLQGFQPFEFNYVIPWSYAGSLGLMFSLLCIRSVLRHVLGRTGHALIIAGLAAGLALLCKQEFGAACYLMLTFVLLMEIPLRRSVRTLLRGTAACAPGVLLWVVIYGWFFWTLTPAFMVFDNWVEVPGTYFMRAYGAHWAALIGLRFIPSELIFLVLNAVAIPFLWFEIARLCSSRIQRDRSSIGDVVLLLAIATAPVYLRWMCSSSALLHLLPVLFPSGMFFIGCAFLIYALCQLYKRPSERQMLATVTLGVFALTLAIRVPAQIMPLGYSIFYDLPLLLVFIVVLVRSIAMAGRSLAVEQRRKLTNSLLAAQVIMLAIVLIPGRSDRTARLETSWGVIYLQPAEAKVARQVIDFVSDQKEHGRRVAILPELPMVYALTRTEAPSRWYTLVPGAPSPDQEGGYISDLKHANPDYIVLTNRYTGEYGPEYFGIDYDHQIVHWIETNYRTVGQFGSFRRDRSRTLAALVYQRQRTMREISHTRR